MRHVIVEVEMLAFAGGQVRQVDTCTTPDAWATLSEHARLELVFTYGQNEFAQSCCVADQRQRLPSVSVGDVVRLDGRRHKVAGLGFEEVP